MDSIIKRLERLEAIVRNLNKPGRVTEVMNNETGIFARVIHPDRDDLNSKWLPVGQAGAGGLRTGHNLRIGQSVMVSYYGNSIEDGVITSAVYTPTNPPPMGVDPSEVFAQLDDGSYWRLDPRNGSALLDFNGPVTLQTLGTHTIKVNNLVIEAPTISIKGDITMEGQFTLDGIILNTHKHTGVMTGGDETGGPVN